MGFMDDIKSETKKYGGGGSNSDFFEFKEGVNKMRLLTQPKVIAYHFPAEGRPDVCVGIDEGCTHHKPTDKKPTIRLCTYIIDRDLEAELMKNDAYKASSVIKFAELPLSISYAINDLQKDSDFAFSEFPMDYDVKITHDPKNPDPKAKYRLVASPKQVALTTAEMDALDDVMKKMTPEQYVQKRKDKQMGKVSAPPPLEYPRDDINPDDIPF